MLPFMLKIDIMPASVCDTLLLWAQCGVKDIRNLLVKGSRRRRRRRERERERVITIEIHHQAYRDTEVV